MNLRRFLMIVSVLVMVNLPLAKLVGYDLEWKEVLFGGASALIFLLFIRNSKPGGTYDTTVSEYYPTTHSQTSQPQIENLQKSHGLEGIWYKKEGDTVIIGAKTQSAKALILLIPWLLVGLMVFFFLFYAVVFSFQALGDAILFWVIGLFSLLIFIFLSLNLVMWSSGEVVLFLSPSGLKIFKGISNMGTSRNVLWKEIRSIKEKKYLGRGGAQMSYEIVIETNSYQYISFGRGSTPLNHERRKYLLNFLLSFFYSAKKPEDQMMGKSEGG